MQQQMQQQLQQQLQQHLQCDAACCPLDARRFSLKAALTALVAFMEKAVDCAPERHLNGPIVVPERTTTEGDRSRRYILGAPPF